MHNMCINVLGRLSHDLDLVAYCTRWGAPQEVQTAFKTTWRPPIPASNQGVPHCSILRMLLRRSGGRSLPSSWPSSAPGTTGRERPRHGPATVNRAPNGTPTVVRFQHYRRKLLSDWGFRALSRGIYDTTVGNGLDLIGCAQLFRFQFRDKPRAVRSSWRCIRRPEHGRPHQRIRFSNAMAPDDGSDQISKECVCVSVYT